MNGRNADHLNHDASGLIEQQRSVMSWNRVHQEGANATACGGVFRTDDFNARYILDARRHDAVQLHLVLVNGAHVELCKILDGSTRGDHPGKVPQSAFKPTGGGAHVASV